MDDVVDGIQDKVFVIKYTQSQKSCLFKNERDDLFFTYDVPGYEDLLMGGDWMMSVVNEIVGRVCEERGDL